VTSVPVLADDKSGIIDPVPGLPASHFVYHGDHGSPVPHDTTDDHINNAVAATQASGYGATGGGGSSFSDGDDNTTGGAGQSVGTATYGHSTPNRRPVVRPRRGLSHALATHTPAAAYDEHL
jgi:hypothetical protein